MKLVHPEVDEILDFDKNPVYTLVIENQEFYYKFICDIMKVCNGESGDCVFSDNDVTISANKYVELITDFIHFDINKSTILSKVNQAIEKISMDEIHFEEAQIILSQIERFMDEITLTFDANFYCDKISISQLIKACGIKAEDDYSKLEDKVYAYMNLANEFLGKILFVFVNFHAYVDDMAFKGFVDTAVMHGYKILFLDNKAYNQTPYEKRIIIDSDLCLI